MCALAIVQARRLVDQVGVQLINLGLNVSLFVAACDDPRITFQDVSAYVAIMEIGAFLRHFGAVIRTIFYNPTTLLRVDIDKSVVEACSRHGCQVSEAELPSDIIASVYQVARKK